LGERVDVELDVRLGRANAERSPEVVESLLADCVAECAPGSVADRPQEASKTARFGDEASRRASLSEQAGSKCADLAFRCSAAQLVERFQNRGEDPGLDLLGPWLGLVQQFFEALTSSRELTDHHLSSGGAELVRDGFFPEYVELGTGNVKVEGDDSFQLLDRIRQRAGSLAELACHCDETLGDRRLYEADDRLSERYLDRGRWWGQVPFPVRWTLTADDIAVRERLGGLEEPVEQRCGGSLVGEVVAQRRCRLGRVRADLGESLEHRSELAPELRAVAFAIERSG
jgi:hypothetical protein